MKKDGTLEWDKNNRTYIWKNGKKILFHQYYKGNVSQFKSNFIAGKNNVSEIKVEENIMGIKENNVASLSMLDEEMVDRITTGVDGIDYLYGYSEINGKIIWGLPRKKISVWAGEGGVGKTRVAIHVAKEVAKRGYKVLYFQGEVNAGSFKEWVIKNDKNNHGWLNNFLVSTTRSLPEQLEIIRRHRPDVVFEDSINMIYEFNSGTGKSIRNIIDGNEEYEGYREICELGPHVIFISHLNKEGDIKGSSDFSHLIDTVIELKHLSPIKLPKMSDSSEYIKHYYENKDCHKGLFNMEVGKNRYGKTGLKTYWGHEEDGVVEIPKMKNKKWLETRETNDKFIEEVGYLAAIDLRAKTIMGIPIERPKKFGLLKRFLL